MVQSASLTAPARKSYVLVSTLSWSEFERYLTVTKTLSQNSIRLIKSKHTSLFFFLKQNKLKLDKLSIEKFIFDLKKRGLNNNSLNSYIFAIRNLDDFYKSRGAEHGFSYEIKSFKKFQPMINVLSIEEIEKLLSVKINYGKFRGMDCNILNRKYTALTRLFATTGCRFSEAVNIKFEDLNLSSGRISFNKTKNGEQRFAFISQEMLEDLKFLTIDKKPGDFVFTNMSNTQISAQCYKEDIKKRAELANLQKGKRVYAHLFRHSFVSEMGKRTKLEDIAKLVGHKDIQTTYSVYYHAGDDYLESKSRMHPLNLRSLSPDKLIELQKDELEKAQIPDPRLSRTVTFEGNKIIYVCEVKP